MMEDIAAKVSEARRLQLEADALLTKAQSQCSHPDDQREHGWDSDGPYGFCRVCDKRLY
jgi:hypothetical protein